MNRLTIIAPIALLLVACVTQPAEAYRGTSLLEEVAAEIAASKSRARQSPRQVVA